MGVCVCVCELVWLEESDAGELGGGLRNSVRVASRNINISMLFCLYLMCGMNEA